MLLKLAALYVKWPTLQHDIKKQLSQDHHVIELDHPAPQK